MKPHCRAVKNTGDFENPLRRTKPPLANMACETSPTSALTKCTENCAIGVAYVCANHCRSASDIRTTDRQRFPQISSRIQPFFHSPFLSAIRLTKRRNDNNKQRPAPGSLRAADRRYPGGRSARCDSPALFASRDFKILFRAHCSPSTRSRPLRPDQVGVARALGRSRPRRMTHALATRMAQAFRHYGTANWQSHTMM